MTDPNRTMTCAMCGQKKHWRDGFPTGIYAECWRCVWKRHVELRHKPRRRWHFRWPFYRDPIDLTTLAAGQIATERNEAA